MQCNVTERLSISFIGSQKMKNQNQMKLNLLEFVLMNSPIRSYFQENYELPILMDMLSLNDRNFGSVLEIGCGNGYGTTLIKKNLNPRRITGVDIDEKMIQIAKRKVQDDSINFLLMDASRLSFADEKFDAIFNFGIIHHIPDWKECINELKRVLRCGGKLIMEDLSIETFSGFPGKIWKKLLAHPYNQMYSTNDFMKQLEKTGFVINDLKISNPLKMMRHFSLVANAS